MNIAILGAGMVGGNLGRRWAKHGHTVRFGLPNPNAEKYDALKAEIGDGATWHVVDDAVGEKSDAVVLATPWAKTEQALASIGNQSGRVLIDCTNPLTPDLMGLTHGLQDSGGEQVARWCPSARVVKAFSTVGANIMINPVMEGRRAAMFICGDDDEACLLALRLSDELGFETIRVGQLAMSRTLEPLALMWISLAFGSMGRDFALSIVRG